MKSFEIGNPEPLCYCYGGLWIDVENGTVKAGGYTQTEAWSSFDPRPDWNKRKAQVEMTTPEFVEIVLFGRERLQILKTTVFDLEKREKEAKERLRCIEQEIQRVKNSKAQARRDYRRKIKKLVSLLDQRAHK